MKFKKMMSFFAMVCVLITFVFTPWYVSAVQENISDEILGEEEELVLWKKKMQMQEDAIRAYSELRSLFGVSELGMDIFPDDYAGAWIEDNNLIVGLTSFDSVEKYDVVLGKFNCVQYVKKQYSLNQLYTICDSVYDQVKEDIDMSSFYVHVMGNNIVYEVLEEKDAAEQKIKTKLSTSRLSPFVDKDITTMVDEGLITVVEGGEISEQISVYGGGEFSSKDGREGTIGICGIIHESGNDYPGFITCSHGMTVEGDGSIISVSGQEYGSTFLTMYYDYCYGDWSAVRKTSNVFTQTNKVYGSQSGLRNISGTKDEVPPGTFILKYGFVGKYCRGTVEENNATAINRLPNGTIIRVTGMSKAVLESNPEGTSEEGDSGGPYYINNGMGGYTFVGVHAGLDNLGSNKRLWFTPYKCFKTWFTSKTN